MKWRKTRFFTIWWWVFKVKILWLSFRKSVPLSISMKAHLSILCLLMASAMAPIQSHAAVAEKGLVCSEAEGLLSKWTVSDKPLLSVVAHWFDEKRVSTLTWQRKNDSIEMKATRRGIPYETDMSSIRWTLSTNGQETNISIDRNTGQRSVMKDGIAVVSVDCELFDSEKVFQEKLKELTNSLQSSYDLAIANHKL